MMADSDKEQIKAELPEVTFSEFKPTTYEVWKDEAIVSLKGGSFEKKLFTKTYEGIGLEPIYTMEHTKDLPHIDSWPGSTPFVRGTYSGGYISHPWEIAQSCDNALPILFNVQAKQELAKGGTAVTMALDEATLRGRNPENADENMVGNRGLSLSTLKDIQEAFLDIDLEKYPIHAYTGASSVMVFGSLAAIARVNGQSTAKIKGCIGSDPLGTLARDGEIPCSLDELYDEMAHAVAWASQHMPQVRTILVQGEVYHNGGANDIQELAYAMAAAIEYIRALQVRGLNIDAIAKQIRFGFSLGSNFFMEIAKIRAARMIWAQIVEAFGGSLEAQKMNIHARTSLFTKTLYDPYVNMLRTTTEAFSGVVGGIESMQVACFDEAIRPSEEFSRRIARNTQVMLKNECNLLQPIDPAGGSWYIETLTHQVGEKVWALLQQVEGQGGMVEGLKTGWIQQSIIDVLNQRFKNLASRADRAVGTNMYPNISEQPLEQKDEQNNYREQRMKAVSDYRDEIDEQYCQDQLGKILDAVNNEAGALIEAIINAFQAGATIGEIRHILNDGEEPEFTVKTIDNHRWTEEFETMRKRTEDYRAKTGDTVKVFLANMGKIPQHKPRADFTTGFMEVAAFEVLRNDGFPTVEEAAQAAVNANADVTVICSTDDTYPELVPPLARLLKAQCPNMKVVLAGAPASEYKDAFCEAGVDYFIHVKANCYQILTELQKAKGMF